MIKNNVFAFIRIDELHNVDEQHKLEVFIKLISTCTPHVSLPTKNNEKI